MSDTRQPSQKKSFTTTISLEQVVHRRLKHLAVDRGVSVRNLIREAIEEYLEHHKNGNNSNSSTPLG
jgi:predicted DNA-binding ribbon-helix-helix protein